MRIQDLPGRKVAIWGFGREGRAVLNRLRARVPGTVPAILNDTPLGETEAAVLAGEGVAVVTGRAVADALAGFDVVIKSPGVSRYRPEIERAESAGVLFTSATRLWFAEHHHERIVCVTGTKGKSTTSSLVAHMLRGAGLRIVLAGNMGDPVIEAGLDEPPPDVWVLELSSYQTSDLDRGPSLGVLLNLYPEHLDWHGSVERYYLDKVNLFVQMREGTSILNREDRATEALPVKFPNPVYFNDTSGFHVVNGSIRNGRRRVIDAAHVPLRGRHNLSNVCAALTVARQELGADMHACVEAIGSFKALPHRLSLVGERDGILYVDDSISTTPQSAMEAIKAFEGRPTTVILGGYDRGLFFGELAEFLLDRQVHAAVTLPDSGRRIAQAVRLAAAGRQQTPAFLAEAASMEEAVEIARSVTPGGGVVLLSPASPSYGRYKNFEERGRHFTRLAGFQEG